MAHLDRSGRGSRAAAPARSTWTTTPRRRWTRWCSRRCCPRWSATSATRPRRTPSVTRRAGHSGWRGPRWPPSSAPHRTRSCSPPAARSPTRSPSRARSGRRWRGSPTCRRTWSPRPRSIPAVLAACAALEHDYGVAVTYLPVDRDGLVDPAAVEAALRRGDGARVADGGQQRDRHPATGPRGRRHHPRLRGAAARRRRPGRRQGGGRRRVVGRGPADGGGAQDVRAQGHRGPVRRARASPCVRSSTGAARSAACAPAPRTSRSPSPSAPRPTWPGPSWPTGRPAVLAGTARPARGAAGRPAARAGAAQRPPRAAAAADPQRQHRRRPRPRAARRRPGRRRVDRVGLPRRRGRAVAGPDRHGPRPRAGHGRGAAVARPVDHGR